MFLPHTGAVLLTGLLALAMVAGIVALAERADSTGGRSRVPASTKGPARPGVVTPDAGPRP